MRFFLDTEFHEDGRLIDLISIALVGENGHEYYAVAADGWDPVVCNDFVREHVLPKLPPETERVRRSVIAADVRALLLGDGTKPEIWGYFADYDWVVLCQLFGRMVDLPKGMPFYCRDLKQAMDERGIRKDDVPIPQTGAHDALNDARWVRNAWLWLERQPRVA